MSSLESLPANTEWASVHSFRYVTGGINPGFKFAGPPINPFVPEDRPLPAVPIPDFSQVPPSRAKMSDPLPKVAGSSNVRNVPGRGSRRR